MDGSNIGSRRSFAKLSAESSVFSYIPWRSTIVVVIVVVVVVVILCSWLQNAVALFINYIDEIYTGETTGI